MGCEPGASECDNHHIIAQAETVFSDLPNINRMTFGTCIRQLILQTISCVSPGE